MKAFRIMAMVVMTAMVSVSFVACGGSKAEAPATTDETACENVEATCNAACDACCCKCDTCKCDTCKCNAEACETPCEGACEGACEAACEAKTAE